MTTAPTDSCPVPLSVRITKSLLGYGVLAGPIYVATVAVQAVTREGFDPVRYPASVLANGSLGWVQVANFLVSGVMTVAAGVGVRRAVGGRRTRSAGALIAGYGAGLIGGGLFRADPLPGFPPGTVDVVITWHGIAHLLCGAVGFACVVAAGFVLAAEFAHRGNRGWARFSRLTGAAFAASFIAMMAGAGAPAANVGFTAGVVLVWVWLAAVSVKLYGQA
ncbi:hypothetical protein A5784_21960 [Mycobacterium sp. 852013-50091_SCH5140682]|uniref:DUF998 domain-containing protein n=1 Tax=Mycobacterium sp. 852013-50091_SCH5140682 TaxID=1834109 RepID=UPI0007EA94F3|nr:DUF998 domain-containing protein [Mycobacterium sp. 852013-50091_SCH5140682]OBB99899.1 hypothetical protein A5784_21960 [Mycobacterium sp. 852013-50091_SCH5140682]